MNSEQKGLVARSWKTIVSSNDCIASLFYTKLFELDPTVSQLFSGSPVIQCRMVRVSISLAVNGIEDEEANCSYIALLGVRHAEWGVTPYHWKLGERALLAALADCLGETWSPELRRAWQLAYRRIARVLIDSLVPFAP